MIYIKNIVLFLIMFAFSAQLPAQNKTLDSLKAALKNAANDTTRCNILNQMIEAESNDKIWPLYNDQLLKIAENCLTKDSAKTKIPRLFYLKYIAASLNNIGFLARSQGNIAKALEYYNKSLKIYEEIKEPQGTAVTINNIGFIYQNLGDIPKALDYYHRSLKIQEAIKDKNGSAASLNNIGLIYGNQEDVARALEYYQKSLKIYEEIKNKKGIAISLNNIGFIYKIQGNASKELEYYNKSLKIQEEIKDQKGIALCLNNIGGVYNKIGNIDLTLEYCTQSLKIYEEIKDKKGIASALNTIALALMNQGKTDKALTYAKRSLQTANELGFPENIKRAAGTLKDIYKKRNNFRGAMGMYEMEIQMRDSINNEQTKKASIKKMLQYQYEKKAAADSVKNAEEQIVKNAQLTAQQAQLKQEKTQRYALYGGLMLMLVFAGLMFNRFKITQRQKNIITLQKTKVDDAYKELNQQNEEIAAQRDEIEKQKHKVEEHQKEIIDSITYAKRLQEAILPPTDFVTHYLPENFILYKPKDLVAGDFYWAESVGNKFLIAAADSTGHGVPGAMVSVVCSNALNRSLKEFGLTSPGLLLDKTRDLVLETFSKSSSEVKDGMDISLLSIEKNDGAVKLTWAGANNPLWYLLPNATELSEIKANKQPIGKTDNPIPFTTHEIEYVTGTTFYLFTDGYADQFGGPKGKKFKYKALEDLLFSICHLSMAEQNSILKDKFDSWKGDLEQVDDVCIIGVKI